MEPLEARAHPRMAFAGKVSVLASASAAPLRLPALDVSEGGMCLATTHPFRRGDRVGVRIQSRHAEVAIPLTEVAWVLRDVKGSSRTPAVGLRFLNLKPAERLLLKQILEAEQARPAPTPVVEPSPQGHAMHAEPSLPPPGDPIHSIPPTAETLPPSDLHEAEPSLGPLPAPGVGARWEFSEASPDPTQAPRARRDSGNNGNFAIAAGLLVVGTLAGVVFGLMDQSARPHKKQQVDVAQAAPQEPAALDPGAPVPTEAVGTPVAAAPMAAAPIAAAPVAPAPVVAAAPAPKPVAAAPVAAKPVAPKPAPVAVKPAAKPAPIKTAALPVPSHRPGHVSVGGVQLAGKDLVIPIRGAHSVEKQFVLKGPDRVVLDLKADAYDGPVDLKGAGSVRHVRVGKRPGGIRLVLDVANGKAAAAAKVSRRNGVMSVVIPAR